jgi:stromal membrane-associated protein
MGNERANCYWEAELPPNYDRVGIENFIRAKYAIFHLFLP